MAKRTIFLKGYPLRKEAIANATITPGMLVEQMSTGRMRAHATAGGPAVPMFAFENELFGKQIDENYAAQDNLLYGVSGPGHEVYALLPAGAAAVIIGDFLESAGDGTLRKQTSGVRIARAMEAVDNSAGGTTARITVEIL